MLSSVKIINRILCGLLLLNVIQGTSSLMAENKKKKETPITQQYDEQHPLIKKIVIEGNKHIKEHAIRQRLPFHVGKPFDADKSAEAIRLIYGLGFFKQIEIEKEQVSSDEINLYIVVTERKLLEKLVFKGNKKIKTKKIEEKLSLEKIESIDEEQIKRLICGIQDLYKEENYHRTKVDYVVDENEKEPDKAKVFLTITEGPVSRIRRVHFIGNTQIPDKKLRTSIFTREDWLLRFMDDGGKYSEEMFEMDKKRIEFFYRDKGYLTTKVVDASVVFSEDLKSIDITFEIKEGDQFIVRDIHAPGDDIFDESELMPHVLLEAGEPFSQSKLADSITRLKSQWGSIGYIYADVYPQVVPDEETKEVDITFYAEKGKKMRVNRIDVTGNKTTRDKVIRREILIEEGDLLTTPLLNQSRDNVEYLGFFERGGTNWKMHKISDDEVDLEMNVKEGKTGHLNFELSIGGGSSPDTSARGKIDFGKNNFMGYGWDVGSNIESDIKRPSKNIKGSVYFFDPYILDSNVSGKFDIYARQEEYDQWRTISQPPQERVAGASARFGLALPQISRRLEAATEVGFETIYYKNHDTVSALGDNKAQTLSLFENRFRKGDLCWLCFDLVKDTRNHRIYPNRGFKVLFNTKTALPIINKDYSFIKVEADWSWYTPIIGQDTLVLGLHSHAGIIDHIASDKIIPYKELFHMGGQTTVRGFTWGGIGPAWKANNDPVGARKAILFNAELIFPIIPDYSMKGHVFYDAGAGWDTPRHGIDTMSMVTRNNFNVRHSVGFGLNLMKPSPVKIDWGYKLDRDRKSGESPHEFHIMMNAAF